MAKLTISQFNDTAERQAHYLAEVDRLAEQERIRYLTTGSGQAMTYEVKYQEALAGGGPMLQAEADALGIRLEDVVATVLAARNSWLKRGTEIEGARLKAKKEIRESTTSSEMHTIVVGLKFLGNG